MQSSKFRMPCAALSIALIASITAAPLLAQVPPGWCAIARTATATDSGGVSLIDTMTPGATVVEVVNMPQPLVGIGSIGSASVLISSDGSRLLVGEFASFNVPANVFVLDLSGTSVVDWSAYQVAWGGPTALLRVMDMDWYGEDVAIVCNSENAVTGPLAGNFLGVFRPRLGPPGTPGVIEPVPVVGLSGVAIGVAVDERAGYAYLAYSHSLNGHGIWRIPFPGDGTPHVAGMPWAWVSGLQAVELGADGNVYAATGAGVIVLQDVGGQGMATSISPATSLADVAVVAADGSRLGLSPTGQVTITNGAMTTTLTQVVGSPRRLAYRATLEVYTESLPSPATPYQWQLAPNPGGHPALGNSSFSVTIAQPPTAIAGLSVLAFGQSAVPIPALGVTLLVDPASAVVGAVLPAGPTATVPLPIPLQTTLLGLNVYAQTIHWEGTQWAMSPGMRVRIVP